MMTKEEREVFNAELEDFLPVLHEFVLRECPRPVVAVWALLNAAVAVAVDELCWDEEKVKDMLSELLDGYLAARGLKHRA